MRIAYSRDYYSDTIIIKCKNSLATFVQGIELSGKNEVCLINVNGDDCDFLRKGLETRYNEYIDFHQEIMLRQSCWLL